MFPAHRLADLCCSVLLQIMHKSPLSETKQVEHVVNERRILGAAAHPFCVRLLRAFQDTNELYLLQEWVGGEIKPCMPSSC